MERRDFISGSIIGIGLGIGLIIFVVVTGSTFGQRCRAAGYAGAALERCVERASDGGPIYEENIGWDAPPDPKEEG